MGRAKIKKIFLLILVVVLVVIFAFSLFFYRHSQPAEKQQWGLTFSPKYAKLLGFDWKTLFLDMLADLKPKKLRLMAYWDTIEPKEGQFDFVEIDQMLDEATKQKIEVVLVVGRKQPRWPECHQPAWVNVLSPEEQNQAQLSMVKNAVEHFKKYEAIKVWQVENEPFFQFGPGCPKLDQDLVQAELQAVRAIDNRPIMLTDSGEWGNWQKVAALTPDILGSTMYRIAYQPIWGFWQYPFPPQYFRLKSGILLTFFPQIKIVGVELQSEPWFDNGVENMPLADQFAMMNPKIFRENIEYAKKAGFEDNYLWGVEWWYWLAKTQNNWGMWEAAKELLRNP